MTLDEKVFRKMGLLKDLWTDGALWSKGESAGHLPPISSSWEVCAEYLVPFMREGGWDYTIYSSHFNYKSEDYSPLFIWWRNEGYVSSEVVIKDDNIAFAACESFMEIKL